MWERALRRASLPVTYSGGFSPRPQLSFGLALPTGCESTAEYLDVSLAGEVEPDTVAERVGPLLPIGIGVTAAGMPEPGSASLQEQVTSCTWVISAPGVTAAELDAAVREVMSAESLPVERERKGRAVTDDLRPSLLSIHVVGEDRDYEGAPDSERCYEDRSALDAGDEVAPGPKLHAELATRPRGVRPVELARVMGIELGLARRTCQWIEGGGSKFEPLDVRVAAYATVAERAS